MKAVDRSNFPIIMLRTSRGMSVIERLSRLRLARTSGWVFLYLMPLFAAVLLYFILGTVSMYLASPSVREAARAIPPTTYILFPGLNPFLPIVYGWLGIVVALVVHEGAHGVLAKAVGIPVKSAGLLLLTVIPIGAFVELDEKEMDRASLKDAGRVVAAGPGSNVVTSLAALLLMLLVLGTMAPATAGLVVTGVVEDYPAHGAGIIPGDIIVGVDGRSVASLSEVENILHSHRPGDRVSLSMQRNEERFDRVVQLAAHPENETIPVLGVQLVDAAAVLEGYRGAYAYAPFVYLVPLPLLEQRGILVPFSDTMHPFYNSSLGAAFYPLANFLFWVWFVNLNVGLFNALPIYPLDGGQAFRKGLKALAGGRLTDASVKKLTAAVSVAVFLLIISLFFAPYLDLLQIRPPST